MEKNIIKIKLLMNGEFKEFECDFISLEILEKVFAYSEKMDDASTLDIYKILVEIILLIFEGKFTEEELKKGIDARDFINVAMGFLDEIMGAFWGK